MKEEILENLENPAQLERLYRADKSDFKRTFKSLYPQLSDNKLVGYWNERLMYTREDVSWGSTAELIFVIIVSLMAGLVAKLPVLFSINEEFFYPRNIGFVVFPALCAYFIWKNKVQKINMALIIGMLILGAIYINLLPDVKNSDTLMLSCIHLPLSLWATLGFAFVGQTGNKSDKRLGFLRYSGDLVVMTTLILLAGGLMSVITVGLFELIGFDINKYYFDYVAIFGLSAAPIVGTHLTQTNPQLVGKVSPVIAKIFSPLVLIMLVIYLAAIAYSGKNPYSDREFLLVFNALLVGVMAIIFFSVAETSKDTINRISVWVLFILSVFTVLVNGIAISAILFRISEWGITPNRAAVLGGNALILVNLILVTAKLFQVLSNKSTITGVGKVISHYLPVYFIWALIVTFIFPLLFWFK
ncbi:hypothetical protein L0657_08810 [Dyadobacter sp. CY345]|uniref:hypothetical protein n=1 Tax=Dyadobacter sp. CY345 TaxID=2909335 RepID=UPI001F43AC26|nr:hypothetical protein [Dyadobacter sp. CY345]MCF2444054.1 hypothetical protein [Dyadobacter sp. CY345]